MIKICPRATRDQYTVGKDTLMYLYPFAEDSKDPELVPPQGEFLGSPTLAEEANWFDNPAQIPKSMPFSTGIMQNFTVTKDGVRIPRLFLEAKNMQWENLPRWRKKRQKE